MDGVRCAGSPEKVALIWRDDNVSEPFVEYLFEDHHDPTTHFKLKKYSILQSFVRMYFIYF